MIITFVRKFLIRSSRDLMFKFLAKNLQHGVLMLPVKDAARNLDAPTVYGEDVLSGCVWKTGGHLRWLAASTSRTLHKTGLK